MTQKLSSTLATLGEFGLISRITAGVAPHKSVITGIGDDAAVTALTPGMRLLSSTDMLLEDVHFGVPGMIRTLSGANRWRSVSLILRPWGVFLAGRSSP